MRIVKCLLPALLLATFFSSLSYGVTPDRIARTIDPSNVVVLKGHVSPFARPQFDQGPVASSRTMHVTMLFMPSAQQTAALEKLIAQQQDSTSPYYHQWLTAQQYGQRFGLSQADIDKVSAWLVAQGFKINYVANGKNFLSFEGSAGQIETAFRTQLHNFNVNGKMHFANVTAPAIPAALNGIVGGFRGLHDFFPRSMLKKHPDYTFTVTGQGTFTALAPGDLATIYDINPAGYSSSNDGTGLSVVIAGQTDVYLADLVDYRTGFSLSTISGCTTDSATHTILQAGACSSGNFEVVWPEGLAGDPGLSSNDLGESDLDIETISAVARGAKIIFVTSGNGVDDSAGYAIDNQLAPVISYSYGLCEAFVTAPNIAAVEPTYMEADALGISFFAASGDAGAATCDGDAQTYPADLGLSVSYPASSKYIIAVGGTEFNEAGGSFWNSTNNIPGDGKSVKSYIPELAWNDSDFVGGLDATGGGPSNCAFGTGTTGVSVGTNVFEFELCNAPTTGGFPKPTWQSGMTLPDSVRDVPDISFSASNANDPYIVCTPQSEVVQGSTSSTSTCVGGISTALSTYFSAFGGTSASTPVAAAMTVLLNQSLAANGLGNISPELYKLYVSNPLVFHDIGTGTSGTGTRDTSDNIVSCSSATPNFEPSALQCPVAGSFGYSVVGGHHYSAVTGLGSVDMNSLFTAWAASSARTGSSVVLGSSSTNVQVPNNVTLTATVAPATSTGTVTFSTVNNSVTTVLGTALVNLPYPTATTGTATLTVATGSSSGDLPGGSNSVTAAYEGDGSNKASTSAAVVVTVTAPDFSMIVAPASTSVVAGHTSSGATITFTPINGFNQTITPSCTGLPTGATCIFSPTTVTLDGTHTATTSMTIQTLASMAATTAPVAITISATGSGQTHTTPFSLSITATDQTYTLSSTVTSYSVKQGGTATVTVTVNGTNSFNTPVTFTCSNPTPESTCTALPASSATGTTLTITTTAPTAAMNKPSGGARMFYAALLPGLLGIMFTVGSRKRSLRGMRMLGLILVLGVSTMWLGSCSGSNGGGIKDPGTTPGTYSVTVTATTNGAVPVLNTNNPPFAISLTVTQ